MRCLENHDQPRIASFVKDEKSLVNYTAFLYFLKGTTLIYAGQEYVNDHVPSLFDKDVFDRRTGKDITPLLDKLCRIKKDVLSAEDYFKGTADDANHIAVLERDDNCTKKLGVFSLKGLSSDVKVDFPDGTYINCMDGETVQVKDGMIHCSGKPIILSCPAK